MQREALDFTDQITFELARLVLKHKIHHTQFYRLWDFTLDAAP